MADLTPEAVRAQVVEARVALAAAVDGGEYGAISGALDALEESLGLARLHGVEIPAADGSGRP
ncbi:hypothetical protein QMK19_11875 [Streptomyces sp. H10-C2]|uniref:hypothetical protein n=1 Tax=unclassified Streptomyces TaxID=2593676 RepID=UPI0024BAE118|nr:MULTISPECIES: hypothetical protein [unclassified Streptomyces]MDJ0341890.1 hypothetical protein [Streptomyces sp. PH10-H1]MDJ0370356.1 hypothetical protein [Streptomyces sp. H10-C2]